MSFFKEVNKNNQEQLEQQEKENKKKLAEIEKQGPKLGIFSGLSNSEYHGGPGISKSGLDLIDRSPAHYIEAKRNPKPPTKAMIIGSAFHCLVLEPEKFDDEFAIDPNAGSYSAKAKEYRLEMLEKGITLLSDKPGDSPHWNPSDWDLINRMCDAVMANEFARILLDRDMGEPELSCYWLDKEFYKLCKCRPDFWNREHKIIVDLKSTEDASYTGFAKSVAKWRYHVQHAFYMDGMKASGEQVNAFVFIAVEKTPPYGVGIYQLDAKAAYVGRNQYRANLELFAKCHSEDVWPCYEPGIRDLQIPEWGLKGNIS